MSTTTVYCEGISKRFGEGVVFDECSLAIGPGTIYGLVGLNGAGKTTLIRVLLGLLKPSGGAVTVLGHVPWEHSETMYGRVGVVLENDGFAGNLTIRQNLGIFAAAKGISWAGVEAYIREFWAGTFIHGEVFGPSKKTKYFSRGQRMQCSLCRAFLGWPSVCFFDEPTVALDVEAYDHFCRLCRVARQRGAAMLISSHQLSAVEDLCDAVGVLVNKKLRPLENESAGCGGWSIAAGPNENFGAIIERITGNAPSHDGNSWHFTASAPKTMVPDIVEELVRAGCRIGEVSPDKNGLREKIRTHYEKA
jgi:ABC-2 type transport system ATP-binding protein